MENNKGITLISLISSIILIMILTSITITTSMSAYNKMKFEGAKAEIEQMQKLVDEIATDYQTYKQEQHDEDNGYASYFKDRYNVKDEFSSKLLSNNKEKAGALIKKVPDLESSNGEESKEIFYFTKDDINKYFDLKGINDVVVDFSTRTVYSVDGINDPENKGTIYYQASDWDEDIKVKSIKKENNNVIVNAVQSKNSSSNFDVKITINGKINNISEVYGGIDDKYSKIDNFRIISSNETSTEIIVSVSGAGNYKFKIVDELNNTYETSGTTQLSNSN